MNDWIKALAAFGLKTGPFYLPLVFGFIALNWYLKMRQTKSQEKPKISKKIKRL